MNNRKNVLFATLLLSILVFLTACSQPANQTDPASTEDASTDAVRKSEYLGTVSEGALQTSFEESNFETLEDGIRYRYGTLSASFDVEETKVLAELPIVFIAYPDGTFGYVAEESWLKLTTEPTKNTEVWQHIPEWYVYDIITNKNTMVVAGDDFISFMAAICNASGDTYWIAGSIAIEPELYFLGS